MIITAAILLVALLGAIIKKARVIQSSYESKWAPFECGLSTPSPQHLPFSIQFFLVAILFLVFDVEISLLVPFPIEEKVIKNRVYIYLFITILLIGLLYE
jgi:NADH-ubiquinone oxidoreductase chain 3